MLPAPVVAVVLSVCFPHFAEVLKVQKILTEVVLVAVAQLIPVVPAHYKDREISGRPGEVPFLSFLW